MRTRPIVFVAVALAAIVASGCSNDDDPSVAVESDSMASSTAADATAAGDEHNDADVTFAQVMIPHHERAVEMAVMASERAGSPEVLELAARIEQAQQPEIELMRGWLATWGDKDTGMEMGDMNEQMTELEAAGDTEFDRMFLEMMIEHHSSAIEMAEQEVADGAYEPAIELAGQIIDAQQAEIELMQSLLDQSQG